MSGEPRSVDGDLAVLVLSHGGARLHEPLVDSLLGEGVPASAILLVHNPAERGEPAPPAPQGVELIQAPKNLGYAAGMNLGLERLRPRRPARVLVLTHDARLRAGALARLLEAGERNPRIGVLGPALVLSDGEPFSFGGVSNADGTTVHLKERPAGAGGIAECDWVDGGTMLIRDEVFDAVGGFDERFWSYCEESDLCLRARRAGFGVGVVLDAVADQEPGGAKRLGVWSYLLTRNGAEYARRAAGRRAAAGWELRALRLVVFNLLRVPLRLVRRRPGGPREPWLMAVGIAWGALDFLRGRWGPPPRRLPGMGDVSNV